MRPLLKSKRDECLRDCNVQKRDARQIQVTSEAAHGTVAHDGLEKSSSLPIGDNVDD